MRHLKALLFGTLIGIAVSLVVTAFVLVAELAAHADIMKLEDLYIDYKNFGMVNDKNRTMLTYPEPAKEQVNLGLNMSLFDFGYFNPLIEGTTTDAQYRGVGLVLQLGVRLSPYVELGYYHHSEHVLDRPSANMPKFPVQDALELKFYLYRSQKPLESVFGAW